MAIYHFVLVVAFTGIVLNNIRFVRCADQCKTHADCKARYSVLPWHYCCGGYFGSKDRSCTSSSCLNSYCSKDSDCGDSTMCCRSDECVNKGCSGCRQDKDCDTSYHCCKKTSPFNQTICAVNCLNKTCNFNDDCAGYGECCRSGKCTDTGCSDKCTLNSECSQGQYCCKKKTGYYGYDSCAKSCVGEICSRNEDCGPPNECCISNKCVDRGCSGCTTNSNCSTGQYCCKKRHWYELSECSDHCIGKSCNANDDCGGPDETCDSHLCGKAGKPLPLRPGGKVSLSAKESSNPLPPWGIAVITVSLVVFLIAVGILLGAYFYVKRKRAANRTQAGTVPLRNSPYEATETSQNQQPSAPPPYQALAFQVANQPEQTSNVAHPSSNSYNSPRFHNGTQGFSSQVPVVEWQNPALLPQQGNENHGFSYHRFDSPDAAQDTVYQNRSGQQVYPQHDPFQSNNYPCNPPYNPQYQVGYQGNH